MNFYAGFSSALGTWKNWNLEEYDSVAVFSPGTPKFLLQVVMGETPIFPSPQPRGCSFSFPLLIMRRVHGSCRCPCVCRNEHVSSFFVSTKNHLTAGILLVMRCLAVGPSSVHSTHYGFHGNTLDQGPRHPVMYPDADAGRVAVPCALGLPWLHTSRCYCCNNNKYPASPGLLLLFLPIIFRLLLNNSIDS